MKTLFSSVIICLFTAPQLHAGEENWQKTVEYVKKLQTPSGGFAANMQERATTVMPSLRSTTSAIRALHYMGADLPNPKDCERFVDSCFMPDAGGFAVNPKAKPDVLSTAVGLMAVTELKMPTEKYAAGAVRYLSNHAQTFEDIRIAAAGLEGLREKSPNADDWIKKIRALQNADGSFGNGPGQARATGGGVVTLLRLGVKPNETALVLKVLKAGQRPNGGFGSDKNATSADLESTYRIMRCFVMLKSRPDNLPGLRSFIDKCRNDDGGYGVAPGEPSSVNGIYFAAIITHWLKQSP